LKWANAVACVVQGVTGVVLLLPGVRVDAYVPVYSHFATNNRTSEEAVLLAHVNVGYLPGVFLLLSCLDHAVVLCIFPRYQRWLQERHNPLRWAEYFFSATLMHVLIALLCGVFDLHLVFAVAGLTATTMLFGHLQEETQPLRSTTPQLYVMGWGFVPWVWQWAIVFCYFFRAVAHSERDVPAFVWGIVVVQAVLDFSFAWCQKKQQTEWQYVTGELWFIALSIAAKQALAWLNYGGTRSL